VPAAEDGPQTGVGVLVRAVVFKDEAVETICDDDAAEVIGSGIRSLFVTR